MRNSKLGSIGRVVAACQNGQNGSQKCDSYGAVIAVKERAQRTKDLGDKLGSAWVSVWAWARACDRLKSNGN